MLINSYLIIKIFAMVSTSLITPMEFFLLGLNKFHHDGKAKHTNLSYYLKLAISQKINSSDRLRKPFFSKSQQKVKRFPLVGNEERPLHIF